MRRAEAVMITLTSSNPDLSWVINKNPHNICEKLIRQGKGIGEFINSIYQIKFHEGIDVISYPEYRWEKFDFLSVGKYLSPLLYLNLIDKFFRINPEKDIVANHVMRFNVRMKRRSKTLIEKYLKDVKLVQFQSWHEYYIVLIQKECTLREFLDYIEIMLWMITLDSNEPIFITNELATKIAKKALHIQSPYWIRYVLKCRLNIPIELPGEKMVSGSNLSARIDFVKSNLLGNPILDIGCGEGNYFFLAKHANYTGIDPNLEPAKKRIARMKEKGKTYVDSIKLFSSLEEFLAQYDGSTYDIILSEVIEHIEEEDLTNLMKLVNKIKGRKIITTPNLDFNHHYQVDLRHEDHVREWTYEEITQLFSSAKIYQIGDIVDGISTTTGIIYEN